MCTKLCFRFAIFPVLALATACARASTVNVPAGYSTIQAAINAAQPGDTILVAAGTYGESLDWENKDLTIQGSGAATCIVDPTARSFSEGRCLLTNGLTGASSISGICFQHGFTLEGGGILNSSNSLSIADCTFSGNFAEHGGAISNDNSSPTLTNCIFSGNSSWDGGGMLNSSSSPTLTNCTFTGNGATRGGGGGIENVGSNPTVTNCTFNGNSSRLWGGGINNFNSIATIANCTFSGNSGGYGGGIGNLNSVATIANCTFSGNSAGTGGAIGCNGGNATIANCILWGNAAAVNGQIDITSSTVSVANTILQGLSNSTPDADGNFSADPLFVRNPSSSSGDYGDLRLRSTSPCIDKGNNSAVSSPPFLKAGGVILDLDGNPRIVDGGSGTATVDMGAYEFQPIILQALAKVQALINQVKSLVDGGAVLPAAGQSLYAKLDAAVAYLQAGDVPDAITKLQDFINQVKAFVKTSRLSAAQGNALIASAQAIITLLGG